MLIVVILISTAMCGTAHAEEGSIPKDTCLIEEERVLLRRIKNDIIRLERSLLSHIIPFTGNQRDETVSYSGGGATYVRWGRTQCQQNGTELVYSGVTATTHYSHSGGTDYLCLTTDVTWGNHDDRSGGWGGFLHGVEYGIQAERSIKLFGEAIDGHNAPCSVCRSIARASVLMMPGRFNCFDGWHLEYNGYLSTSHFEHKRSGQFACVDAHPEKQHDGSHNSNEACFYFVDGKCGTLPCPPYINGREIPCVVCTK